MAKIKAVLFDMDGVLIDAKSWHYESLNRALSLFGMSISLYEHLNTYDGLPTRKKLEMLSKERNLPRSLHEFINKLKQKYTIELIYQHCKPHFRHQYALSRLKQEGYQTALCSNSIRETINVMMDRSDLNRFLDLIFSNEDIKMPKPSPEIYQKAIAALGRKPEECLIIEDNHHGLEAARLSGGHVMQVDTVDEVNWDNIQKNIRHYENLGAK